MKKLRKVNYARPGADSFKAYFHGFFQWQSGDEAGPIALIESEDGNMYEVSPMYMKFLEPPIRKCK